jgi:hypothetical protein
MIRISKIAGSGRVVLWVYGVRGGNYGAGFCCGRAWKFFGKIF